MDKFPIDLKVNGEPRKIEVEGSTTLLQVLRDYLQLTGTKEGCGMGDCGACTVLVDGKAINSCIMLAVEANGSEVVTIEGLARGNTLDPLQEAFMKSGAVQCGYCTPGMIMAAKALLNINPMPSDEEIRSTITGNLCRCTGYVKIMEAVKIASCG